MVNSRRQKARPRQSNGPVRLPGARQKNRFSLALIVAVVTLSLTGCSDSKPGNDHSNSNSNRGAAVNANSSQAAAPRFLPKEPDPYSATMTIAREGQSPLQIEIAK